jgi:hypothetical protein
MKTSVVNLSSIFFTLFMLISLNGSAQNYKAADSDIHGLWVLESMQWDGEKKTICGSASNYTQYKYYGANGEYCCAEVTRGKDGKVYIRPHEYGTYTYKDGWYSEMGREKSNTLQGGVQFVDKNTFKGRWKTLNAVWKRTKMTPETTRFIIDCCKVANLPSKVEDELSKTLFK